MSRGRDNLIAFAFWAAGTGILAALVFLLAG